MYHLFVARQIYGPNPNKFVLFFSERHSEDVGALVDDNFFERDILIAAKKLSCLSNILERIQGNKNPSENLLPCSLNLQSGKSKGGTD